MAGTGKAKVRSDSLEAEEELREEVDKVFSQLAVQRLDVLPPSAARDSLAGLAEFVVSRQS